MAHDLAAKQISGHEDAVEPPSDESGVRAKADSAAVARLAARLETSDAKWRKLYSELQRRDPKGYRTP